MHNGPLAGLVAICGGSDLVHPLGALVIGAIAGALFVQLFTCTQNRWKIDDVLGVWPLHGPLRRMGWYRRRHLRQPGLGGLGGVSFMSQLLGTLLGITVAVVGGYIVYALIKRTVGLRLDHEEEYNGADLSIHKIGATSDSDTHW